MSDFVIALTLPLVGSSQNYRTMHEVQRHKNGQKRDREYAGMRVEEVLQGMRPGDRPSLPLRAPVRLLVVFFSRGNCPCGKYHPRDVTNAAGSIKGYLDGMVDAGVLPGDDVRYLQEAAFHIQRVRYLQEERVEFRFRSAPAV